MPSGFINPYSGFSSDGENWTAIEPLMEFWAFGRRFRIRKGGTTDGPSIPHWTGIPRTGKKWPCGAGHDAGYRDDLEEAINDAGGDTWSWHHVTLTKDQCDLMFRELLLANGVDGLEAEAFYIAVKELGEKAFAEDRGLQ